MSRLTLAQRSNFWPLTAWGYHAWRKQSLTLLSGEKFTLEREARLFLGLASPQVGEHWLDIGTSTGFYAGVLARAGCQVDALDLSPAMLRSAEHRKPSASIRWQLLNGEDTGLANQTYDGVTIGATLNETAHPDQMLREAARLLKPGGLLWLMYIAKNDSPGQRLLQLSGLNFPYSNWLAAQLPNCYTLHRARFGRVEFALLQKESRGAFQV